VSAREPAVDAAVLDAVLAEVRELRAEVAALRDALAPRARADLPADLALLQAVNLEVGAIGFSAASLIEHAELEPAAELRAALGARFPRGATAKRVGRWLARMRRRGQVGAYAVEHQDDGCHRGGVWTIAHLRV
jgi:hypothetical protein